MFFAKIFRRFFFSIDAVLFNFIGTLYDLLIAISRTSILTQGDIATFAARIEVLLGIFMLFKVSFSLITYVVNPDDFSDKSKGFGKLIQSSVISLVLLVLVPYIFQMAFSLQTKVLEGNILARLILGEDSEQSGVEDNFMTEAGEKMAYYVMLPFFKPNYSINLGEGSDLSECINIYQKDDETDKNVFSEECKSALTSVNENQRNGMDDTDIENYSNGITEQSLGLTFRMNAAISTVGTNSDEQFVIDYKSPISTVVAVIVCLLLVSFCIDIGIRSIKLAFLQLIYPIPVISFMDPKSGKDGMFSKWYKMCFSTFVSLFVRLLALYFGLYIISKVGRFGVYDVVNGSQITNGWVMIFVIIGVLMFIKQLPKILENMGIKLEGDGKFNLNPLKRLEEGAFGGKALKKAAIGLGAGGLAGAAALGSNALTGAQRLKNAKGFKEKAKALLGAPGSMLAGGMSGLTRGIRSGIKGEKLGKSYSDSYSTAMKNKQTRSDRKSDDVGWGEMMSSKFKQNVGMHTGGEKVKSANDVSKKIQSTYDSMMNAAKGNDTANFSARINGVDRDFNGIKGLDKFVQELKKTSISRDNFTGANAEEEYLNAVANHQKSIDDAEDAMKARLDSIAAGTAHSQDSAINSAVRSGYKQMQDLARELNDVTRTIDTNISTIADGASAKAIYGTSKGISNQIISSEEATHQQTVDEYAKKKEQK